MVNSTQIIGSIIVVKDEGIFATCLFDEIWKCVIFYIKVIAHVMSIKFGTPVECMYNLKIKYISWPELLFYSSFILFGAVCLYY